MVRITEAGDTLWTRDDLTFPDTAAYATLQFLHSAVELPSGSIIASGYYEPNVPGANLGILIKVDRNGCMEVLDCHPVATGAVPAPPTEVRAWPSPASGQVTVSLPHPLPAPATWSLYGATGRRALVYEMGKGASRAEVPLAGVPPGLYFWEAVAEGRRLGSGKLVVLE